MQALLILVVAYLIGSLPSAVIVARLLTQTDIRQLGDGNMGARNVQRTLGWAPGILVAGLDFGKGILAVSLSDFVGASLEQQMLAGAAAVLGHDWPLFAGFRGGQGMATSLGVLMLIAPLQTGLGLVLFGAAYLVSRNFDWSAGLGLGSIFALLLMGDQPRLVGVYALVLFLSIPVKKALDAPRRHRLRPTNG